MYRPTIHAFCSPLPQGMSCSAMCMKKLNHVVALKKNPGSVRCIRSYEGYIRQSTNAESNGLIALKYRAEGFLGRVIPERDIAGGIRIIRTSHVVFHSQVSILSHRLPLLLLAGRRDPQTFSSSSMESLHPPQDRT